MRSSESLIRNSAQTQTYVNAGTLGLIVFPPAQAGFGFLRGVWPSHVGDKELHCIDQTQLMDAGFIPGDLLSLHCRAAEGLQSLRPLQLRDTSLASSKLPWDPPQHHQWLCLIFKCSARYLKQSWGLFLVCPSRGGCPVPATFFPEEMVSMASLGFPE